MRPADWNPGRSTAGGRWSRRLLFASALLATELARAGIELTTETLKIGVDVHFPPYSYYDDNRRIIGLDPALAREACRRIGVLPVFVPIAWNQKDELLASGRIDCIWSCLSMNGREARYRWIPYLHSRQVVVVRQSSRIRTLSDLDGNTVALQSGTLPEKFFLQHPKAPKIADLVALPSMGEAFLSLHQGYSQAVAGHEAVLLRLMKEVPGTYRVLEDPLLAVKVGVAFPLDSKRIGLIERLKHALSHMATDGETARLAAAYDMDASKVVLPPG